jgi:hypothetical protein
MTRKKQRVLLAKKIRTKIKGLDFVVSQKLARTTYKSCWYDILYDAGYVLKDVVDYYCDADGDPIGSYQVLKDGKQVGVIDYTCCGIDLS